MSQMMLSYNSLILANLCSSKLMHQNEELVQLCYNVTLLSRTHQQLRFQTIYIQYLMPIRLCQKQNQTTPILSEMHLSDALSRLSTHQLEKGLTLPGMDITVHEVETCTNFSSVSLGKIRELTLCDNDLQVLKTHIINGFPLSANQCPECIRPFFPYRDELMIFIGLILKGSRIVIPTVL